MRGTRKCRDIDGNIEEGEKESRSKEGRGVVSERERERERGMYCTTRDPMRERCDSGDVQQANKNGGDSILLPSLQPMSIIQHGSRLSVLVQH